MNYSAYLIHLFILSPYIRIISHHIIISKGQWQFDSKAISEINNIHITLLEYMVIIILFAIWHYHLSLAQLLNLQIKFYHRCLEIEKCRNLNCLHL